MEIESLFHSGVMIYLGSPLRLSRRGGRAHLIGKLKLHRVNSLCVCTQAPRVTDSASSFRKINANCKRKYKLERECPRSPRLSLFPPFERFHERYRHYYDRVIAMCALLSASLEIFDVRRYNY